MKQLKQYKIIIENRNYSSWHFVEPCTNIKINIETECPELLNLNPIDYKLFSRDIFTYSDLNNSNGKLNIEIVNHYLKPSFIIAGVLQLENNKTFGRTANKKRLLYKCIPDDKHLPSFLIPYDIKMSFSKVLKNKYVVFKYDNWNDKHPHGMLHETIGDVDIIEAFYEYQLYCKSLHISLTDFTNKTREILNKKTCDEYVEQILKNPNFNIEDNREQYIFTIDPLNSTDFDDGFSIVKLNNGLIKVSVYISNVYFWLETLGLWNSFSRRVSTIYLPDRRRPMLPTILSDTLCSLQKGQLRFALAMDILLDQDGVLINDANSIQYKNVLIKVSKNYVYEDPIMLAKDEHFKSLFDISQKMDENINDTHDLVAHWMIFMNLHSGNFMMNEKVGIFRSANYINPNKHYIIDDAAIDHDTVRVIKSWNNVSGQYILFDETANLGHDVMNIKSYTQITSPIRRLVDLLNLMILSQQFSLVSNLSNDAQLFLKNWLGELDYLNASMRSIRKIQTDCDVLNRCFTNPNIMMKTYDGIIFDKIMKNDGNYSYMVYLKDIKLLSRFSSHNNFDDLTKLLFKIYLFEDEDKTKKKIRLQLI
jgi:exoribonuclease R